MAFLLSFDLRDYPSTSSGFVPFGVRAKRPELSRIIRGCSPFA
jgi:hypothetical protein